MSVDQRAYWVWLQHALGAGSSKQNRILSGYRSLNDFYAAGMESWLLEGYFTQSELGKLSSYSVRDAEALLEYCEKIGQQVLTPGCAGYPEPLGEIHNTPCALYVKGTLPDFSAVPSIAVVGTRKATATGVATARSFAFELAKQGAVVVSGGALGIDTAAHKGALQAGGKTVCVLGCGIDYNYLMGNASLREAIALSGAVISEYPPNTQAVNSNFPIRNRIISGLTLGTLVVEAAGKSGSLITAQYALEQGRDVFAVPAGIYSPVSQGVNGLIKSGAKPVSNAGEILEEYLYRFPGQIDFRDEETNVIFSPEPKPVRPEAVPLDEKEFSEDAVLLYSSLADSPKHLSELERLTGISAPRLLTAVTELELAEKIRSHSGRRYSLPV
ncbi:DNA-processing protein DprA [Caproiciproducens sp. R1]|uniref:DNA-processing protein DprA n=1 Tax=Caproiciproducens sp. R1 TaxID=3435000 RepID=UPI0040342B3E